MLATKQDLAVFQAHFEALNWGNIDNMKELETADFAWHNQSIGRTFRGLDGYRAYLSSSHTAFPDFWAEISHLRAGTQSGVCEYVLRGAHKGTLHLPGSFNLATRQQIDRPVCEVFHIVNGRLVQIPTYVDLVTLYQQPGLLPRPTADPASCDGFIPPIVYDN